MPCGLCHKQERGADERKDYLCGLCIIKLTSMNKAQKSVYVDTLYSQGKNEGAGFIETFFKGKVNKSTSTPTKIIGGPKLLIRKNGKI